MNCLFRSLQKTPLQLKFFTTGASFRPLSNAYKFKLLLNNNKKLNISQLLTRNRTFFNRTKANDLPKGKVSYSGIRRLLGLAKPEKWRLVGAMVLLIVSSGVTMIVPFFIGKLIDFIQNGDKETLKDNLKKIALWMTVVFIIGAIANFGRVYIIQSTGQRIVLRLREKLFKSIMSQEMAFF